MTSPTGKPAETTAVARPKKSLFECLSPEAQAKAFERRALNQAIAAIRSQTWSKDLNEAQMRTIVQWSRLHDVDPITEVEILGGRLYLNANYYGRRLSELIASGRVVDVEQFWIHIDERVEAAAKAGDAWAVQEQRDRWQARIEHRVPDDADAALVFGIKLKELLNWLWGVKYHVPGLKQKRDATKARDPVGDEFPTETIETRAMRRAMLLVQRIDPRVAVAPSDVPIIEELATPREEPKPTKIPIESTPAVSQRFERLISNAANMADTQRAQREPVPVQTATEEPKAERMREPGEEDAPELDFTTGTADEDDDDRWIEEHDQRNQPRR